MYPHDPPDPMVVETEEKHREPRWLLAIAILFEVGVSLLLIYYVRLPDFLR